MENKQIQGLDVNGAKPTVAVPNQLSDLNDGDRVSTLEGQVSSQHDDIIAINDKIPEEASSTNQLADKQYVVGLIQTSITTVLNTPV